MCTSKSAYSRRLQRSEESNSAIRRATTQTALRIRPLHRPLQKVQPAKSRTHMYSDAIMRAIRSIVINAHPATS